MSYNVFCKAQWVCVHQRIALYKSDLLLLLLLLLLLSRGFATVNIQASILLQWETSANAIPLVMHALMHVVCHPRERGMKRRHTVTYPHLPAGWLLAYSHLWWKTQANGIPSQSGEHFSRASARVTVLMLAISDCTWQPGFSPVTMGSEVGLYDDFRVHHSPHAVWRGGFQPRTWQAQWIQSRKSR